jgi:ATP-dependent RNA helicase DeaD
MENEPRSTATPPDAEPELAPITLADLPPALREAATRMGWKELMPVQARAIPYLRAGRDVMVQSRTGSGKTGAFLLPILERVDASVPHTQALILVPTRELARQVSQEAEALSRDLPVRATALYGGVGYGPQLQALRDGAHVVVATPGRILDHLVRGSLSLKQLRVLVFDEADRMLSVGFYPDIKALAEFLPRKRNGYMFSATYPPGVLALARQFLDNAETLNLSHGVEHVVETLHVYYEVPAMEKERCLVRIIEIENPESAIIFTNTKATANFVSVVLQRFGYDADRISSDLSQAAREQVLERVYDKKLRFLVATDLAARGIDIEDLSHVFLYEFPEDPESYIHRVGRTGRAGAGGEAISLVDVLEKLRLKTVVARYSIDMQRRERPTDADVQKVVAERVTALLEAKLRGLDRLVRERMGRMLPLVRTLAENEDEHAVIAMLLDEYYQQCLHAPPTPVPGEAPPPAGTPSEAPGRRRRRRRSRSR